MPEGTGRIVTTEELARFAECRLAWWYDRTHPLGQADGAQLARRLELLGAVYGPGARDLPEYQLLRHLHERAEGVPIVIPQAMPRAAVRPAEPPQRLIVAIVLIGALVVGGVLASIVFSLTQR